MNDNPQEFKLFAALMWGVAEDFGGKLSKEGLKMRFKALQEYSIDQITGAGTWLLRHREKTFPAVPTTKEFIDVIEGWSEPKVSVKTKAEMEAACVLQALRKYGRNWTPDFADPTTQQLMTTRWPWFSWASRIREDEEKWWKKDFIALYEAHAEVGQANRMLVEGPGSNIVDIKNLKKLAAGTAKTL